MEFNKVKEKREIKKINNATGKETKEDKRIKKYMKNQFVWFQFYQRAIRFYFILPLLSLLGDQHPKLGIVRLTYNVTELETLQ